MVDDLGSAVSMLIKKFNVNPRNIAVGGASIGANIALRYAVRENQVPFAVLLSPGIDYQGIVISDVMPDYHGRSLFIAVCPGDGYAYQSVLALGKMASKDASVFISEEPPAAGHGVQMFRRDPSGKPSPLELKIIQWIQNQKVKL